MKLPPDLTAKCFELAGEPLPPPATEAEFQTRVVNEAIALGYRAMHIRPVRIQRASGEVYYETPTQGSPGFPDTVIVGHGRVYVFELKMKGRTATADQEAWLDAFRTAGVTAHVIYPTDAKSIHKALANGLET